MGKAAKVGAPNAQGRIAHGHGKDEEEAGNAVAFSQACEGSGVAGEGRGGASGVGGKGVPDVGALYVVNSKQSLIDRSILSGQLYYGNNISQSHACTA